MNQTTIKFDKRHQTENNEESELNYIANLDDINNNCRTILEQLLTGRKLTGLDCAKLGILEYRRRFKDLIDVYKIPIESEYIKGKAYKRWFLDAQFIFNYKKK